MYIYIHTHKSRHISSVRQSINARQEQWNTLICRTISGDSSYLKMLSRQFIRNAQLYITMRCFTRSSIIHEINKNKIPAQKGSETVNDTVIGTQMHRVTDFDKKMLVWTKRYPSIADVPKDVSVDCILTVRNKARIKLCNYMIVITLLGCLSAIIIGKKAAERGENLHQQREEWLQKQIAQDKNK